MAIQLPQPAGPSNTYLRKILRRWWKTLHVAGGRPTADVLRYDEAGGDGAAGIAPTPTLVGTLAGLLVAVSMPGQYSADARRGDIPMLRENEREFIFLDLPALEAVAAGTLLATDRILFEARRWKPRIVFNDVILGLSSAVAYVETR